MSYALLDATTYNHTVLASEFERTFPLRDESRLVAPDSLLVTRALEQFVLLQIPLNASAFDAVTGALDGPMTEAQLVRVFMLAALGNLVRGSDCALQSDPVTGSLVPSNTYTANRVLVFEVLVFVLVLALGVLWFFEPTPPGARRARKNA